MDGRAGSVKFRPRARLIGLLGEELISDEPVAVVELVKNAYDADAKSVEVRFEGTNPDHPDRIVVEDTGHGMSLHTVETSWLEPGTNKKRLSDMSPGGRLYQGAKGIGRFAAARLAQYLLLESKIEGETDGIVVRLDWGRFNEESYLDEITIDYEVKPLPGLVKGTRLTLEGLRKGWRSEDYEALHARLSRLVSPFNEVNDFLIELKIPGYPQWSGAVDADPVTQSPKYLLRGILDGQGKFTGSFLVDGELKKPFVNEQLDGGNPSPICGPFEVEIRAWDRDREGLEPLSNQFSRSITDIRKTLNTFCGVSIYRDGFRVHPYGEKGNDWLNLDVRSRQKPAHSLANNQVIAAIRISRDYNPGLRDRSTREGMILNDAHKSFEDWFKAILLLLENERYDLRPRKETVDKVEPLFEAFDLSTAVGAVRAELGINHPITLMLSDTEKQVKDGVERVQEVFSRLLLSAGLGQMVDMVIHEIGSPLGKINRQLMVLQKNLDLCQNDSIRQKNTKMLESINGWLSEIHGLRQRLDPHTPAMRGRATSFDVHEELEDIFALYQPLLDKQQITWKIQSTSRPLVVKMNRASLGQIFANLVNNSIYWISKAKGAGNGGTLLVRIDELEHGFRVIVSDDGLGIQDGDRYRIFEPYFTRKPSGMGLGLYISRLSIEPYGKLVLSDDSDLSGACFEATFERGVGR